MKFIAADKRPQENCYWLKPDDWDDYGFVCTFDLWDCTNAAPRPIGAVKIGKEGLPEPRFDKYVNKQVRVDIPERFATLTDRTPRFFSLGQDSDYYKNLGNDRAEVLEALNDIAYKPALFKAVESERIINTAFLRFIAKNTMLKQFSRLAAGKKSLQIMIFL